MSAVEPLRGWVTTRTRRPSGGPPDTSTHAIGDPAHAEPVWHCSSLVHAYAAPSLRWQSQTAGPPSAPAQSSAPYASLGTTPPDGCTQTSPAPEQSSGLAHGSPSTVAPCVTSSSALSIVVARPRIADG